MTHAEKGRSRRKRCRGDRGAALVEFAIIAPLVFALLLGLFSGGIAMSHKNSMTSAVREGARMGATLNHDSNWSTTVENRVIALAPGDLTASQVCAKLVKVGTVTPVEDVVTCPAALAAKEPTVTGVSNGECVVLVWASRNDKMEFVFASRNLTLDASSVSRYERTC